MTVPAVVSAAWLQGHLADPGLLVVDNGGSPEAYLRGHVPGALAAPCHPYLKHFDSCGERTQHVMTPDAFARLCHELGLHRAHHVVVYDARHGLYGARFRAVCRHYGVTRISILDGGWNAWVSEGRPVATVPSIATPGTDIAPVAASAQPGTLIKQAALLAALDDPTVQIWDTRSDDEFTGVNARDNLRRGHVPGARHLPWTDLLDGEDTDGAVCRLRPRAELAALLKTAGLDPDHTVVTYCQAGIRAAFGHWVLEELGYPNVRIYDASMGEWANDPTSPLV